MNDDVLWINRQTGQMGVATRQQIALNNAAYGMAKMTDAMRLMSDAARRAREETLKVWSTLAHDVQRLYPNLVAPAVEHPARAPRPSRASYRKRARDRR